MHGAWYEFDIWRQRQSDLLGEAEAHRLARAARPVSRDRLGRYYRRLESFAGGILGRGLVPSRRGIPAEEEVALSGAGLVEALVGSSSVIELHQEEQGYVIREVDLSTGDHLLYLCTEEPECAAWIWARKTHG
jgi:hypothetical protein